MKRKFEIAYLKAKEKIPFKKIKSLWDLEEQHGVDIGGSYCNNHACATFVQLRRGINKARFFSIRVDSSTDCRNIDEELFMVLLFDGWSADEKVIVRNRFFAAQQLHRGTGKGLYDCFIQAMDYLEILPVELKQKIIGLGWDGMSANLGSSGLKCLLETDMSWIIVSWCLAHRLELSIKDALKTRFLATMNELLLQIYYVYEKSPKKCAELKEIIEEHCFDDCDTPHKGGVRPLRACGTRFVAHNVAALS